MTIRTLRHHFPDIRTYGQVSLDAGGLASTLVLAESR